MAVSDSFVVVHAGHRWPGNNCRCRYDAILAIRLESGGQCDCPRDGKDAMVVQVRKLRWSRNRLHACPEIGATHSGGRKLLTRDIKSTVCRWCLEGLMQKRTMPSEWQSDCEQLVEGRGWRTARR